MQAGIPKIKSRKEYKKLSVSEREEEYFRLAVFIKKISSSIQPKKNSRNSSLSPYSDLTRSHKKSSVHKTYGPPQGHKGTSRRTCINPDYIIDIPIATCPKTGKKHISNSNSFQKHQILEIEPLKLIVIELRKQTTTINGKTVTAPNPEGISDHQRIGPNLKSHIAYMRFALNIPWAKIKTWLKEICGDTVSSGVLQSIFSQMHDVCQTEYEEIKKNIQNSNIVGADETGIHMNGKKWWMHVFRTETDTLFIADKSRSHKIAADLLNTVFTGVLLSDFWGGYNEKFYSQKISFAKCMSHVLRMIEYAYECEKNKKNDALILKNIVLDAVYLKKFFIFESSDYCKERISIEKRLNMFLNKNDNLLSYQSKKLKQLFIKCRSHVFKSLYINELSPDNNGSERDIREIVISKKISKAFRSEFGLVTLAMVKSINSSMRKKNKNIFNFYQKQLGSNDFLKRITNGIQK